MASSSPFPVRRSSCSNLTRRRRPARRLSNSWWKAGGRLAYQTLLGVTGSGKTFTMANVIVRLGRPGDRVRVEQTLAAQLYSEFREVLPEERGRVLCQLLRLYQPEAYVPQRDLFIEKDSRSTSIIEQMRLSATKSVARAARRDHRGQRQRSTASANPQDYHRILTLRWATAASAT